MKPYRTLYLQIMNKNPVHIPQNLQKKLIDKFFSHNIAFKKNYQNSLKNKQMPKLVNSGYVDYIILKSESLTVALNLNLPETRLFFMKPY